MSTFKRALLDTSLFRRAYIICLFLCNVSFVQIVAYFALIFLFFWGVFLLVYNEVTRRTVLRTRYGLWLVAFMVAALITAAVNVTGNLLYNIYNLIMNLHVMICFFLFYAVHTEKHLNFRRELYSICRFIVYTTTVLGIIGLACLMAEISFEIMWIKFIVYENRFTGLYVNPNQLGFIAVVAIFCCHMLTKKDFIAISGRRRVSRIWIGSCIAINGISLLLCDSNGAMVLMIGYAIFFVIYKMFGSESKFSFRQIVVKSLSCLLAGVVIVASLFFVRNMCQAGFVQMMASTKQDMGIVEEQADEMPPDDAVITFEHQNKNIDSGRFKLWMQGVEMFSHFPILGVGKGHVYSYGQQMFENGIKFSATYGILAPVMTDFHNGYITILVCSGIVGFVLFCIFGLRLFKHISMHVFRDDSLTESVLPCMYAFLCSYVVYAFIEEALLYNLLFMVLFFWLILGYTSCFLVQYEPYHHSDSFYFLGRRYRKTLI